MAVTAEEQSRRDAMDVRCLSLCIGMLERVNGVCSHPSRCIPNPETFIFFRPLRRIRPSRGF